MKAVIEKYLPWVLILAGGLRILSEVFPGRVPLIGGATHGWLFWMLGLAGVLWLLARGLPEEEPAAAAEKDGRGLAAFLRRYRVEGIILLLTAASLAMLIHSGYFWDDAINSTRYLAEKKDNIPLMSHVLSFIRTYLHLGRINLLSAYYYFFFYIENVSVYKGLIILMILANQLIFRKVLLEFGFSLGEARLGMLLLPILLQTRVYQDPVSGFYGLMQMVTAEMLLCAFFLSRWTRDGRTRNLVLSVLFFTMGLMTYEVCFPFIAMVFLLLWVRRKSFRQALRDVLPFIAVVLLTLAGVYWARATFVTKTYAGVRFSLDPQRILQAAWRQTAAAFPLSYYSAGYLAPVQGNVYLAAEFMNYDFLSFLKALHLSDLVILAAAFWCIAQAARFPKGDRSASLMEWLVLGFSFALLPVVTVALSDRYQGQLVPGLGYLPVYMEYYGIAVLILCLVHALSARSGQSRGFRSLGLSFFTLVLLLNLQNNRAVTDIMNRTFYYPRNAGEAALHGGILDFMPEDAMLVSDNDRRYIWEANWTNRGLYTQFYGNNSKHLPSAVGDTKLLKPLIEEAVPDENGWVTLTPDDVWLIAYNGDSEHGMTRLGHVRSLSINVKTLVIREAETDSVLCFISGNYPLQSGVQYTRADGTLLRPGKEGLSRVRVTPKGILWALPEDEVILFESLAFDPSVL